MEVWSSVALPQRWTSVADPRDGVLLRFLGVVLRFPRDGVLLRILRDGVLQFCCGSLEMEFCCGSLEFCCGS